MASMGICHCIDCYTKATLKRKPVGTSAKENPAAPRTSKKSATASSTVTSAVAALAGPKASALANRTNLDTTASKRKTVPTKRASGDMVTKRKGVATKKASGDAVTIRKSVTTKKASGDSVTNRKGVTTKKASGDSTETCRLRAELETLRNEKTMLQWQVISLEQEKEQKQEQLRSMEEIGRLQHEKIVKSIEVLRMELQCSICLELIKDAVELSCGHLFCRGCIDDWRLKSLLLFGTCPSCREHITKITGCKVMNSIVKVVSENFDALF